MYKNKYLKYKSKYLRLLKQLGGECDNLAHNEDIDFITQSQLKIYAPNEKITLGRRIDNPGKCMYIQSVYYYNILRNLPNIPGINIPLTEDEKNLIKQKFKELYFKIVTFSPIGEPSIREMAVYINSFQMIPFNGFYQPLLIPRVVTEVRNIQPYNIGCLVIIRRLHSFLDPPPPGIAPNHTHNQITMNGSLGVIIEVNPDNRFSILILAPDTKVQQFINKHGNTPVSTQDEINNYNKKYNLKMMYVDKRVLISIRKENLDLV